MLPWSCRYCVLAFLLLAVAVFSSCSSTLETPTPTSSALIPLAAGNSWTYARERFVRGTLVDRDTLHLSVIGRADVGGQQYWQLQRDAPTYLDTVLIRRDDPMDVYLDPNASAYLNLHQGSVSAQFVETHSASLFQSRRFELTDDSTYNGRTSSRVREFVNLLFPDSSIAIKLQFEHSFVPGIGQVYARFVSDISQCLYCTLITEFRTYELIDYHIN